MKKVLLFLLTLLTALIIMVSCDNSVDYPFDDDVPAVETPEMVPLTFEFIKDGKVIITNKPDNMKFTRNSGAKQDVPEDGIINAEGGDRIKLFATRTTEDELKIICDIGDCYIYGNVMSLIKEDGFADKKEVFDYAFFNLFTGNTHIKSHSSKKLVLPATTLAKGCYNSMFDGCTGLTIAPDLPAEALATSCYFNMFGGCSNLKTAPVISAINLADNCCSSMFRDCTSLTTAPALPATTLAESCYSSMFEGCTSLTSAPDLKAATLANSCYQSMFKGCTSLTSAPELNATTLVEKCYEYMFYGCSSLNYIKCLATYPSSNYTNSWVEGVARDGVFYRDENTNWEVGSDGIPMYWYYHDDLICPLTLEFLADGEVTILRPTSTMKYSINGGEKQLVPEPDADSKSHINVSTNDKISLFADRSSAQRNKQLQIDCTADCKVYGNVMSLIKEVGFENEKTAFTYSFFHLFDHNTHIDNNHATKHLVLPALTVGLYGYECMFSGCTRLTIAPTLPATDLRNSCYFAMFSECSSLATIPSELPATILPGSSCYYNMFANCSSITKAPKLLAPILNLYCYGQMFTNCSNLNEITCLASSGFEQYQCLYNWVINISSTGTFYKAKGVNWPTGNSGIPAGWTVVEIEQ